jgi:hypothetical protein
MTHTDTPAPLQQILNQGGIWQARQAPDTPLMPARSSGYAQVDEHLPAGGWQPGQLCEIYSQGLGQGDLSLLSPVLAELSQQPRWLLLIAPPVLPYAPALEMLGIRSERLLMVHPKNDKEALWCMEEGLRSGHCSAVLGWIAHPPAAAIRRLQVACEESQGHAWLWPGAQPNSAGSPAPLRVQVSRQDARHSSVTFIKRRGRWPGQPFTLLLQQPTLSS